MKSRKPGLTGRALFWMLGVLLIVLVNTVLGVDALLELDRTDDVIAQDYEVALRTRQLREALFEYHNLGLTAALTRDPADLVGRDQAFTRLTREIEFGLGEGVEPAIRADFERLVRQIRDLMLRYPGPGHLVPRGASPFLDPHYRELYGAAFENLVRIVSESAEIVAAERKRDEAFFRANLRNTLIAFGSSIILLAVGMFYLRTRILLPVRDIVAMVRRMRSGDLSVAWSRTGNDEIAEMGRTLKALAEELDRRRRERAQFIGSVAHDLKNPLTAVLMNCDHLLARAEALDPKMAHKGLTLIRTQLDRMNRITDDLLGAATEGGGAWHLQIRSCSLAEVTKDAIDLARQRFPVHDFAFLDRWGNTTFDADPDRLSQILFNLLSNAAKYSPEGSPVEVEVGLNGDSAYVEVRDRGMGIPDEMKSSIFNPFSRLESGRKFAEGVGLGLTNVKDMVSAHHGSIHVMDRVGGGAVFRVELPMRQTKVARNREPRSGSEGPRP